MDHLVFSLLVLISYCHCLVECVSGGGGTGRRPGPGGEEVEQKNPTDASWPPGLIMSLHSISI